MEITPNTVEHKKMGEKAAAALFIDMSLMAVDKSWKELSAFLEKLLETKFEDEVTTKFEYTMALIAVQMQVLPKLLPMAQALRVRNHLMEYLQAKEEEGRYAIDLIKKYEEAWNYGKDIITEKKAVTDRDSFNSRYEPPNFNSPLEAVGVALSDTFYDRTSIELGGGEKRIYNLDTIQLLGESLLKFGSFWQKFLTKTELTIEA